MAEYKTLEEMGCSPGPWKVVEEHYNGKPLMDYIVVRDANDDGVIVNYDGNAPFIAEAPSMYNTLVAMKNVMDAINTTLESGMEMKNLKEMVCWMAESVDNCLSFAKK